MSGCQSDGDGVIGRRVVVDEKRNDVTSRQRLDGAFICIVYYQVALLTGADMEPAEMVSRPNLSNAAKMLARDPCLDGRNTHAYLGIAWTVARYWGLG